MARRDWFQTIAVGLLGLIGPDAKEARVTTAVPLMQSTPCQCPLVPHPHIVRPSKEPLYHGHIVRPSKEPLYHGLAPISPLVRPIDCSLIARAAPLLSLVSHGPISADDTLLGHGHLLFTCGRPWSGSKIKVQSVQSGTGRVRILL